MAAKPKEILLGDDFGEVTVSANGVSVEIHADGTILAHTKGTVTIDAAANDVRKPGLTSEPNIGRRMPDGTIYAGVSPDTGKPMYTTPADASLTMTFNEAWEYAKNLDAHGHQDWRVPTKGELNVLFNNRAAIGGFDVGGSNPAGWYWSGAQYSRWVAWGQRFSDGCQDIDFGKDGHSSVRCVRSVGLSDASRRG